MCTDADNGIIMLHYLAILIPGSYNMAIDGLVSVLSAL